jgi:hypothetical protein
VGDVTSYEREHSRKQVKAVHTSRWKCEKYVRNPSGDAQGLLGTWSGAHGGGQRFESYHTCSKFSGALRPSPRKTKRESNASTCPQRQTGGDPLTEKTQSGLRRGRKTKKGCHHNSKKRQCMEIQLNKRYYLPI